MASGNTKGKNNKALHLTAVLLKGVARVRLIDGTTHTAEVHWYEAHGIGRKEFKIKFPLLD